MLPRADPVQKSLPARKLRTRSRGDHRCVIGALHPGGLPTERRASARERLGRSHRGRLRPKEGIGHPAAPGHEQPVLAFSQFVPEQSLSLTGVLDRSGMIHVSKLMDSQALNTARISRQSASRQAEATAEARGEPGAYCADMAEPGVYVGAAQMR